MNWVAPIKDKETLERFEAALLAVDVKYYILFAIGLGTGMQLQDILKLKVGDIRGRDELAVRIGSQQTELIFHFPDDLKKTIDDYISERKDEAFLFTGYESTNKPLSREQSYRVFKQVGASIGLKSIGTQTMRKTFAWHYYNRTGNIEYIQKLLSHASPSITFRYIGEKPNIQVLYDQLSEDSNLISKKYLLTDQHGVQDIDKLIKELKVIRRQLQGKNQSPEYYGRTATLLEQIGELFQDYKQYH